MWNGKLYLGSISAAISKDWTSWAGVTHIVCVLGRFAGQEEATEWREAHMWRYKGVCYLDWSISYVEEHQRWREVFHLISDALEDESNVVLVHCKNGKDRSCYAVYAFLRLRYGMNHKDALTWVQERVGTDGIPLFQLENQRAEMRRVVDDNLNESIDAESGICCWEYGTLNTY